MSSASIRVIKIELSLIDKESISKLFSNSKLHVISVQTRGLSTQLCYKILIFMKILDFTEE